MLVSADLAFFKVNVTMLKGNVQKITINRKLKNTLHFRQNAD